MNRQRNDYLTDVAKEIADDLLAERNEWLKLWCESSDGIDYDMSWNEMVCIIRNTLINRLGEVQCSG